MFVFLSVWGRLRCLSLTMRPALPTHEPLLLDPTHSLHPPLAPAPPPAPQRGTDRGFCTHNFLSPATMNMLSGMRSQLLSGAPRRGVGGGCGGGAARWHRWCEDWRGCDAGKENPHKSRSRCHPCLLSAAMARCCCCCCCCRAGVPRLCSLAGGGQPPRPTRRPRTRGAGERAVSPERCGSLDCFKSTAVLNPALTSLFPPAPPPPRPCVVSRRAASTRRSAACCRCPPTTARRARRC